MSWTCSICTVHNPDSTAVCHVCSAGRPPQVGGGGAAGGAGAAPGGAGGGGAVFRVLPKQICAPLADGVHGPLFFLAGPLSGGADWQSAMVAALRAEVAGGPFTVAIPYGAHRPQSDAPPFAPYTMLPAAAHTERQLEWERYYLDAAAGVPPKGGAPAAARGCVVFWLPEESKKYPKGAGHGPYAQDTRGELGEWRGHMMCVQGLRVVVGGEAGFPGMDTLTRNFVRARITHKHSKYRGGAPRQRKQRRTPLTLSPGAASNLPLPFPSEARPGRL